MGKVMQDKALFSELRAMYVSGRDKPNGMQIRIRLQDAVDGDVLAKATATAMKRYPYFCVRLVKRDGRYYYDYNPEPVVVVNSAEGVALNSEASNYHMVSISWYQDWIILYMFHALTDGTGMYALLKTLLYYYCSEHYRTTLSVPGLRLVTDDIPEEEWVDPSIGVEALPPEEDGKPTPGLNIVRKANLWQDTKNCVCQVTFPESDFMRFNSENEASPATMIALLCSRAAAEMFPDAAEPIRVSICVNLRKGLHTPVAHQGLVGGIWMEYLDEIKDWPLEKQITAYRGKLFVQSEEERLLETIAHNNRESNWLLSMATDEERVESYQQMLEEVKDLQTATVSYVGKAGFGDIEGYIRDFRCFAYAVYENLLMEVSAINGRFYIEIIQNFSDEGFLNAFLHQLKAHNIDYRCTGFSGLVLPPIRLPWQE